MMPRYRVPISKDAVICYETFVEADTPEEAAEIVEDDYRRHNALVWERVDEGELDGMTVEEDDIEEVTP